VRPAPCWSLTHAFYVPLYLSSIWFPIDWLILKCSGAGRCWRSLRILIIDSVRFTIANYLLEVALGHRVFRLDFLRGGELGAEYTSSLWLELETE